MTTVTSSYWEKADNEKVLCTLCPHHCKMGEGQRGTCYIRGCQDGQVVLHSYGVSSGIAVDPIEKKPLYHFLPGSSVLSFGTVGCNLSCRFCQNWDISKAKITERLSEEASPEMLVGIARRSGAKSIAYTYNDPVIFWEYARDVAQLAQEQQIKSVAVTAGYISDQARCEFFSVMDAANVDLKSFNDKFYRRLTGGQLAPVLDTLNYLANESETWLEITTLLIPGENDSEKELEALTSWVVENLGAHVPLHFSAFHPAWKMNDHQRTELETMLKAYKIAVDAGLHHIYLGNVVNPDTAMTRCHNCKELLIERDWHQVSSCSLESDGKCPKCSELLAGVF
jgi:pyruvate formate lyase activating enzyme